MESGFPVLDQFDVQLAAFILVFGRVGAALMVMPGIGDTFVSPRVRLAFALLLALVVTPVVAEVLPATDFGTEFLLLLVQEIGVGLFIGLAARVLMAAVQVAGTVISFQISLANAFVLDPASGQQESVTANLMTTLAVVLILVGDLHHLLLAGLVDSYATFHPGALPPIGDFAASIATLAAASFRIGVQLAAPFLLVGIIVALGMGLLARLMPQVQIFFIALPLQIAVGFFLLALTLTAAMTWFLGEFATMHGNLIRGA